ncbi:hypothetical protein [Microbacterium sp. 1P06AB]|uniref:hypothetical protein n=1 Tax=Microbacterium sp. 1P06AB TaxID=3132289 RepID=UPI0039A61741
MAITPAEIAVPLGVDAPEQDSIQWQQWALWISDAEMLIDARIEKLDADEPGDAKRDYVVREAVVSHINKPDDATQVTVSVDDGQTSKSYRSGKGRVTIIDEWWALLGLTEPDGAFSIDRVGFGSRHVPWCSLRMGASYCSCGVDIAGKPIYEGGSDDAGL